MAINYPSDIEWKPLIDTTEPADDTALATGDQILEGYSAWANDTLYAGNIPDYTHKNPEINRLYLVDTLNKASELPFEFVNGGICYDERTEEIHLFGGEREPRAHYAYNPKTGTYTVYQDLPYDFVRGSAVYFDCVHLDIKIDGEQVEKTIHILGSAASDSAAVQYYEWDCYNDNWIASTKLPAGMKHNGACIYKNQLHYFYNLVHYVFNKNTKKWDTALQPSYSFINGGIAVINNEILLIGGDSSTKKVLAFNGSSWRSHSTLPFNYVSSYHCFTTYLTYETTEHAYLMLINNNTVYSYTDSDFDSNAGKWVSFLTLLKTDSKQTGICIKNDVIYIFGGNTYSNYIYIYYINIQDTNMFSTLGSKDMGVDIELSDSSQQKNKMLTFKDKDGSILTQNSVTYNDNGIKPNLDSVVLCSADNNYIIYQQEETLTISDMSSEYTSSTQLVGTITNGYSQSSTSSSRPSTPTSSTVSTLTKTANFTINATVGSSKTVLYLYDTTQNKITKYGDISNPFSYIPKLFYLNNNLYAIGGYNTSSQNMYKYNKSEGKWENPILLPGAFNFTALRENKSIIIHQNKLHYFYNIKDDFKHWVFIENTQQWELIQDDYNEISAAGDECPYVTIIDNEIIALNKYGSYKTSTQNYYFANYKYDIEERIWHKDEKSYSLMQKNASQLLSSKYEVARSPIHITPICSFSSSSSGGSKDGYVYGHETGVWKNLTISLPSYSTLNNALDLQYSIPIKQTNYVYNSYSYISYRNYIHYWNCTNSLNGTITAKLIPSASSSTVASKMQHFCFDGKLGIIGYVGKIYKIYSTISTKISSYSNEDMTGSALGLTIPRGYYNNKALVDRKTPVVYNQTYTPENRDILLPDKSYYTGKNKILSANKLKTPKGFKYDSNLFSKPRIYSSCYDYGGGPGSTWGRSNLLSMTNANRINPLRLLSSANSFEIPFANGKLSGYLHTDNKTYYVKYTDNTLAAGDPVTLFTIATAGNDYNVSIWALNTTQDTFSVYAMYSWATSYAMSMTYTWTSNNDLDNSYDSTSTWSYYKNQAGKGDGSGHIAGESAVYLRGITYTHNATKPTIALGTAVTIQEAWTDTYYINSASIADTWTQASANVWNIVSNSGGIGDYYLSSNVNTSYGWVPLSGSNQCNMFGMLRGRDVEDIYQTVKTTSEKDSDGWTWTYREWTWDIFPKTQTIFYNTLTFYLQNITLGSGNWYALAAAPTNQYIQTVEATTDNFFNVYLKKLIRTVSSTTVDGSITNTYTDWVVNTDVTITSVDIPQARPLFNVVNTSTIPSDIATNGVIGQILNNKILNSIYFEHKNNNCYFTLKPYIFNVAFKNYIKCDDIIGTIYNYEDFYAADIVNTIKEKTYYGKEAIMLKDNIIAIKINSSSLVLFQFLSENSLYFIGKFDYNYGSGNSGLKGYNTYMNNYYNCSEYY